MPVSISCLSEGFLAKSTLEGHFIVVDTQMISQVAQLWELEWTLLALQDLVHPLGAAVEAVDQEVVSFILDLLMVSSVAYSKTHVALLTGISIELEILVDSFTALINLQGHISQRVKLVAITISVE